MSLKAGLSLSFMVLCANEQIVRPPFPFSIEPPSNQIEIAVDQFISEYTIALSADTTDVLMRNLVILGEDHYIEAGLYTPYGTSLGGSHFLRIDPSLGLIAYAETPLGVKFFVPTSCRQYLNEGGSRRFSQMGSELVNNRGNDPDRSTESLSFRTYEMIRCSEDLEVRFYYRPQFENTEYDFNNAEVSAVSIYRNP